MRLFNRKGTQKTQINRDNSVYLNYWWLVNRLY